MDLHIFGTSIYLGFLANCLARNWLTALKKKISLVLHSMFHETLLEQHFLTYCPPYCFIFTPSHSSFTSLSDPPCTLGLGPFYSFPGDTKGKELSCQCRKHKRLGFDPWVRKMPLEEGLGTCSGIFAWRISWTESGRLPFIGSQRVQHNWTDPAHMQGLSTARLNWPTLANEVWIEVVNATFWYKY